MKRLDEHIQPLVAVLVTTSSEEVEGVLEIEVIMAIEMTPHEVMDAILGDGVQVLELVHGRELDDVQTIGQDTIGLTLQKMLGLVGSDVRDSGKNIAAMSGGTLNAVTVVDATLACLMIDIEATQVVVEINGASTEVASQEGGVGGEDGRHVDVTLAAQSDTDTDEPLVEMSNDGGLAFVGSKLFSVNR